MLDPSISGVSLFIIVKHNLIDLGKHLTQLEIKYVGRNTLSVGT